MKILAASAPLVTGLVDLLLPGVCAGCGSRNISSDGLCEECGVRLLSLVSLGYCPRCGSTLGPNIPVREDGCFACPNPLPRFASVTRLGPYANPLRRVVQDLKYRHRDALRRRLARLLAEAITARMDPPADLVLAVPSHWLRRLTRGYDHARLLARTLARELRLPLGDEITRIRHTPPQVHLPRSRRIANVRGAFVARRSASLRGARVLLIDDVTTTGATANEATRALLAAGAASVDVGVVAKAEPPRAYTDHLG
jgi:ComF family protein